MQGITHTRARLGSSESGTGWPGVVGRPDMANLGSDGSAQISDTYSGEKQIFSSLCDDVTVLNSQTELFHGLDTFDMNEVLLIIQA